jgi:hypothetical protein
LDPAGIRVLIDAIRHLHGVESSHVETAHVRQVHAGLVVWEGDIDVFQLAKHPKAKRACSRHEHLRSRHQHLRSRHQHLRSRREQLRSERQPERVGPRLYFATL